MMWSSWWVIVAFVVGIHVGIVLMALLCLSSREQDEADEAPAALGHGT
jgi:uncharacterized membrane-anchored protein YhcB (DUF1043 family)